MRKPADSLPASVKPSMRGPLLLPIVLAGLLLLACPPSRESDSKPLAGAKSAAIELGDSPFVEVASRVAPTVVSIMAGRRSPQAQVRTLLDFLFRRRRQTDAILPEPGSTALGSGVIIDERGYVLTNYHVIRAYEALKVRLADRTVFEGRKVKVIGTDEKTDLALLKLDTDTRLPAAKLGNSDSVKVGEWALAVGNPFGLSSSVTIGVVSAAGRSGLEFPSAPSYQDFIQTDAAINPGNSGGPLFNARAEVIGITTAIRSPVQASVGIGFAIPINSARRVSAQLMARGKVTRSWLGVAVQPITPDLKEALGLAGTEGIYVGEVTKGSPADKAGLKSEDIITKLDGTDVTSAEHFRTLIAETRPGTPVKLTVLRAGKEMLLEVRLAEMPRSMLAEKREEPAREPAWLGLSVRNLNSAEKKIARVSGGVRVTGLEPGSKAALAGIMPGDIITRVNRRSIRDLNAFAAIARSLRQNTSPIELQLKRDNAELTVTIPPE
jgi:Do/DeqQ family serine protease